MFRLKSKFNFVFLQRNALLEPNDLFINPKTQIILKNYISIFSLAILFCLSVTMFGADSPTIDFSDDIVCVMDCDFAPSVDIVDSTVPAPSDVVFTSAEATPSIDIHAVETSTAETYSKPMIGGKEKYNRKKNKVKRKSNRSLNNGAFPGQSRSAKPKRKCSAYN